MTTLAQLDPVMAMHADPSYGRIDDAEKPHLTARMMAMLRIDRAASKAAALRAEAARTLAGKTYSEGTLRKCYYDRWLASGRKWLALVNRARVPADDAARVLPEEFVAFWHQLCHRFGGKNRHKAAHRELARMWARRAPIPGFEGEPWSPDLPRGLSYSNLSRKKYAPKPLADIVGGIGLKAAHKHLPGVLTTRAGLPFGSRYVFDDMKHDFMITAPGQMGARELWQFHCIELLSGHQVARGYKAAALNAKTEQMEKLRERELLFLLAHLLCGHGYNPEGCILQMERGTATVRQDIEEKLFNLSGGKLVVQRGATSKGQLAPGLYGGQSGGNPRFKAALESLGHLVHIETSDRLLLPMQTGSNSRIDRPEETYGREHHLTQLQKAMLMLPPAQRELLRLPAPPLWHGIGLADAIQERMNHRTDHDLEGWESCGFIVPLWRMHEGQELEPQTSLALLAPDERAIIERRLASNPRLIGARRLSPAEVWHGYKPTLTPLPAHALPALIGLEHAQEKRVGKDGDFHFEDEATGPDEHHYSGVCVDAQGRRERLPAGEKYSIFVSAIDPQRLHACDARGRYLGACERVAVPSKADAEGFGRACGRRQKAHQELLAPVLAAARPLWQRDRDAHEVNDTMFQQHAEKRAPSVTTPAQRAKQTRRAAVDAEIAQAEQLRSDNQEPSTTHQEPGAPAGLYDSLSDR